MITFEEEEGQHIVMCDYHSSGQTNRIHFGANSIRKIQLQSKLGLIQHDADIYIYNYIYLSVFTRRRAFLM